MRPPDNEPEEWLSLNQKTKDEFHAKWKLRDPEGFVAQELRSTKYVEMKKNGKIQKTSLALPVLRYNMFLDSENELFYDDPHDIRNQAVAWLLDQDVEPSAPRFAAAAIPTCHQRGIIISGHTISEL